MRTSFIKQLRRIHRRLLPDDPHIGWSPYLWLLYLGFLFPALSSQPINSMTWLVTLASMPLFLPLYFRSYWRRGRAQLLNILLVGLLGALVLPFNAGASVYFIYAGAPAAYISTPLTAIATLSGLTAFLVIESILLGLPLVSWLIPSFILMLVGISNLFYCELSRKNARLRLSQDEVSHLATVAERERIARDLHDLLGHSLSLITIKAELAGRLFELNPERARREVQELERVSREALREVRKAVSGYRHSGWEGELENARLALKAAGLQAHIEVDDCTMTLHQESVLSMVLREAVTNVIRHANAVRCEISLHADEDCLRLHIADNGRGGHITPGNGLTGMRERIKQLNGMLQLDNQDGIRLTIELPRSDAVSAIQPWNNGPWNNAA